VRAGAPGQFVVPLDLRERFGVENNAQASDALQAWLERRQPALSERYELDPESSAVWIYASSEADLQRLMDLLGCG
jgi:hypothetical protein